MEIHKIKTVYKDFPACHRVKCLCGEMYTEHKIENKLCCSDCGEPLIFSKFKVVVTDDGVAGDTTSCGIGYCSKCNGVDLFGYSVSDQKDIIQQLNSGITVIHRRIR